VAGGNGPQQRRMPRKLRSRSQLLGAVSAGIFRIALPSRISPNPSVRLVKMGVNARVQSCVALQDSAPAKVCLAATTRRMGRDDAPASRHRLVAQPLRPDEMASGVTAATNGRESIWHDSTMSLAVNWSRLSPRGTAIAKQVGTRLSEGYSPREIACELQTSSSSVSLLLAELQAEVRRLRPLIG
jgi:hypothetical protein